MLLQSSVRYYDNMLVATLTAPISSNIEDLDNGEQYLSGLLRMAAHSSILTCALLPSLTVVSAGDCA